MIWCPCLVTCCLPAFVWALIRHWRKDFTSRQTWPAIVQTCLASLCYSRTLITNPFQRNVNFHPWKTPVKWLTTPKNQRWKPSSHRNQAKNHGTQRKQGWKTQVKWPATPQNQGWKPPSHRNQAKKHRTQWKQEQQQQVSIFLKEVGRFDQTNIPLERIWYECSGITWKSQTHFNHSRSGLGGGEILS